MSYVYNLLLLAGVAFVADRTRRSRAVDGKGLVRLAMAAVALAMLLGEGLFGMMRLLAYAVFVHAVVAAALTALFVHARSRRAALASGAVALLLGAVGVDAFVVEPTALEVNHLVLTSPKISRRVRIALLADLQTDSFGEPERAALAAALRERPDVVIFAGDYIQAMDEARDQPVRAALAAHLRDIGFSAPLGVYAVQGNVDRDGWAEDFAGTGAVLFPLTRTVVTGELAVTGLALDDSFDRDLRVAPSDRFHIVVGHAPDYALGDVQADLLLAGHTHGGQVRLPFIGPLLTLSAVPRAWAAGATTLPGGRTLVVSRGIGLERGYAPRMRFLCRPEIVIIDVNPT